MLFQQSSLELDPPLQGGQQYQESIGSIPVPVALLFDTSMITTQQCEFLSASLLASKGFVMRDPMQVIAAEPFWPISAVSCVGIHRLTMIRVITN